MEWNLMSKYRYSSDWIFKLEDEMHWRLYWYQQKLLEKRIASNERIAEIGVGSMFTYNYLKSKGFNISSIDIDENKNPDVVANIVECNKSKLNYDVILAFNIFEHIPYNEFISVIKKLKTTNVKKIFICVPINRKIIFECKIRLGRFIEKDLIITWPKNEITTPTHHWELRYKMYLTQKLIYTFQDIGYQCIDNFNFRLQSYFYFKRV